MVGDALFAAGLGVALKAYDDITDLNINVPALVIELLKSLTISLFVLLAVDDFSFALVTFIMLLCNYCAGGVDGPFWEAFVYIALLMSFLSVKWEGDILRRLILAPMFPIGVYIEPYLFPEETSKAKTISRIIWCIMALAGTYIPALNVPFFTKLCIFALSYFVTSIIIQYIVSEREKLKTAATDSDAAVNIPSPPVQAPRKDELPPRPERADLPGPDDEGREPASRPMGGRGGGGGAGDSNLPLSG